jgi:hypothetical protein
MRSGRPERSGRPFAPLARRLRRGSGGLVQPPWSAPCDARSTAMGRRDAIPRSYLCNRSPSLEPGCVEGSARACRQESECYLAGQVTRMIQGGGRWQPTTWTPQFTLSVACRPMSPLSSERRQRVGFSTPSATVECQVDVFATRAVLTEKDNVDSRKFLQGAPSAVKVRQSTGLAAQGFIHWTSRW